jgi:PAS domain S-box-containing protein
MDRPVRDGDAAAVAAGEGDGTVRVLHVDGPAVARTAAAFLDRADDRIEVRDATSAEEALSRLERERVDCVVSGGDLPDADGAEFLRAVRDTHGDVPLVLFARGGDEGLAREALAAGVTDYLPVRGADDGYELLAERVVEAVEDRRSRRVPAVDETGTDERRRERVLASLHDATRELMVAECEAEIADLAVRTARDVIGMPVTGCWLYDGDEHALVPVASTPESDALVGDLPTYREGEGLSWAAFETGETRVYADVSAQPERHNPETPVRSEMVLPLGEHGVLNVGSPEADAFDDADVSLARVLAANTEAALDRAGREKELRAQRELVDASLDALDDAFCVFDPDGGLVRWNDSVVEATGYTDEELAGASLLEFLDPADRGRLPSVARELYRSGRARLEADVRTSDGERVPYEFTTSSLAGPTEDEAESGFVVVGRDVTDRRRRLRELERYEGIVEASGDPVYTLDAEGRFTFVNDALVEVVGHDEATLLDSHVSAVVPPADVTRVEAVIRSLLSSDDDRATVELTVVTADGRRVPCETHVTLRPSDGGFRGTVGVVRDVSERIEHVRKLETLQDRTGTLMHTRTRAETGRIAVETAEEVLGVPLCGFNLLDEEGDALVPVATIDRVRETFEEPPTYRRGSGAETDRIVWEVFEAGEPRTIEDAHELGGLAAETPARNVVLHPLGDHGIFIVSSTEPGAFDGTDTVLVEILATALTAALDRVERETLLREREEQLERQNERLEEFASVVSHDLRNPLNVAMGSLDLARETCDADELDAVANAHERMESLIADLLALSRAGDAGEDQPLPLAGAVEGCWRNVETSDATLRVETDRVVLANESLLKQVLENLVGNAVEHGSTSPRSQARGDSVEHDGGDENRVTVTVGDFEGGFYVEDDGPGIPAEERERVFEAGYSTDEDGTGFGLKIVADAARRQGWDVDVTGGEEGGARFEVTGVEFHGE